ncbi:MAG: DUF680 domain-containing protein [Mesorhizobium sp.]|uniref:DUF680 domain-containing protein n=1 Tax=Mesorhizobium sp. TaxID=1871066 RepID=UPI000FE53BEE|nr:DUF680 domain-containing protein [Mesorhizobium sp.]RWP34696.1 MAG: DUF680 domain-containing protein [Mesorhizobium sp.]TIM29857.1 MAG: DUF680 domain-containing protein [Mesorhizobium sp.]
MKKIVFAAVAVLAITGSAFAGSDHYGSNAANQPTAAIDSSYTASIQKPAHAEKQPVVQGADRNLFGNN